MRESDEREARLASEQNSSLSALGAAGLLIAAFMAFTERSLGIFFFLGPLLGIPLFLALIGRPRSWFVNPDRLEIERQLALPWWKRWWSPSPFFSSPGGFRRLSKLDCTLLWFILISIPAAYWAMPWLFPGTPSDWGMAIIATLTAELFAGWIWQSTQMSRLPAVLGLALACIALYFLAWPDNPQDHLMSALSALELGAWSAVRYILQLRMDEKALTS